MSIKPILFNTEMVRAILDDRKTVTRRVVKLKCGNTHLEMRTDKYGTRLIELQNEEPGVTSIKKPDGTTTHTLLAAMEVKPPYRPGDILYVREKWGVKGALYNESLVFRADYANKNEFPENVRWHSPVDMPRWAARIWLRVTDVRVERSREMTCTDAWKEGLPYNNDSTEREVIERFGKLWDSTIKPADRELYGWEANPWVWVIAFERCEKPEGAG